MYSFEGDFRRKPVQSLRGASKKEEKSLLLQRANEERRKREEHRNKIRSSVKIQAFYRGCMSREQQREVCRQNFDRIQAELKSSPKEPINKDILTVLFKQLNFCFNGHHDENRLVWLCQLTVKEKAICVQLICDKSCNGLHQIKSLLHICCSHLKAIAKGQNPVSAPLRVLEVFLDKATYINMMPEELASIVVKNLIQYLISRGYYRCMKILAEAKIPASLERTTTPPTPMSETIFNMITKPLILSTRSPDPTFRNMTFQSLCTEFFCKAYTEQVGKFLLPAMAYGTFHFPLMDLIHALLPSNVMMSSSLTDITSLTVESSPWLLCALLMISENRLASLNRNSIQLYLLVLQHLVPQIHQSREPDDTGQDSDSEDEMDMMVDPQSSCFSTLPEVRAECLRLLNQPDHVKGVVSVTTQNPDPAVLVAVCTVCHTLVSQTKLSIHHTRFLYSLAFNPTFLRKVWHCCVTKTTTSVTGSAVPLLQMISRGLEISQQDVDRIVPLLSMFCLLFSHSLMSLHDAEFYGDSDVKSSTMPFKLVELIPLSLLLRDACLGLIRITHPETSHFISEGYRTALKSVGVPLQERAVTIDHVKRQKNAWFYLFRVMSHLVKQLYGRDCRRQFCPKGHWRSEHIDVHLEKPYKLFEAQNAVGAWTFGAFSILQPTPQVLEDMMLPSVKEARQLTTLMELPFVIPFQERVWIFKKLVDQDMRENQGEMHHFGRGPMIQLSVRRNYLYEDAFEKLSLENEPNMKLRVQIQLMNFAGLNEAGIDGGGVFREFLSELLKTSFDPNRGFFKYTSDQLLYPNPQAKALFDDMTDHYYFIGRMLGKALYEHMLVELPFASFFLSKILSRHGGDVDIHQLDSLDPEVYKNLLFLKHFDGDVSELGLDFTITNEKLGEVQVEELKPGGKDIPVTSSNRIEYIHLVAHHKLNRQIKSHCAAFRHGLADVINLEWLRMFDHHELQVLISGAPVPIDIDDLRAHTTYSGGYGGDHKVILYFWKVVAQFSDRQKQQLLKFVTSCSRPPLLGFKDLFPAFCIHCGGDDKERLPTASTCMNLLKLPSFDSEESMRQKLLYAIESNAGFELS